MTDFVTLIEHHFADVTKQGPKIQVDVDSFALRSNPSWSRGVDFQVEATIKRIGVDGQERIEKRVTKDWLAVTLMWQNQQLRELLRKLEIS